MSRSSFVGWLPLGLVALAVAAPWCFYPMLLMKLMCFGLFACALNLLLGYGGLLSLGHAAFFGASAYLAGLLALRWGPPVEWVILAGVAVAALLGLGMALLATRRQGIYFGMITLALAQLVAFGAVQWQALGGEDGLQSIPRGRLFGLLDLADDRAMYFVVLACFAATLWLTRRIVQSPFGQVIRAIRENAPRATSMGFEVDRFKRLLFVLSAALAGLAGALKAVVFGVVTLADVSWHLSGAVVLMALLGGLGTQWGPVVGAAVIVLLENELGELGTWLATSTGVEAFGRLGESVSMVTGAIFVACVLLFRRGLVGEALHAIETRWQPWWAARQATRPAQRQAAPWVDFMPPPPP